MFLLQLQLYVLTIIRVTLARIHKPLGESPHFVSLDIPFLVKGVKGTNKVSFISDCSERAPPLRLYIDRCITCETGQTDETLTRLTQSTHVYMCHATSFMRTRDL